MAQIVLVHGAFHELWAPHEITAPWVPAPRDALRHHGVEVSECAVNDRCVARVTAVGDRASVEPYPNAAVTGAAVAAALEGT